MTKAPRTYDDRIPLGPKTSVDTPPGATARPGLGLACCSVGVHRDPQSSQIRSLFNMFEIRGGSGRHGMGPKPAEFGPNPPKLGDNSGQHRPRWPGIDHIWTNLDRLRPLWGRIRPSSDNFGPGSANLGNFDQTLPGLDEVRPESANIWPASDLSGRDLTRHVVVGSGHVAGKTAACRGPRSRARLLRVPPVARPPPEAGSQRVASWKCGEKPSLFGEPLPLDIEKGDTGALSVEKGDTGRRNMASAEGKAPRERCHARHVELHSRGAKRAGAKSLSEAIWSCVCLFRYPANHSE